MFNQRPFKALTLLSLIAAACTPAPEGPAPGPDPVELRLAEALADTARANAAVADIEQSAMLPHGEAGTSGVAGESPVFEINWTGPLIPLLHSLAGHAGYSLEEDGARPANPPVIAVTGFRGPLADAVDKINRSLFGIGRITIDHDRTMLRIIHALPTG